MNQPFRSSLILSSYKEFKVTENCLNNVESWCTSTIKNSSYVLIVQIILGIIATMRPTIIKKENNVFSKYPSIIDNFINNFLYEFNKAKLI